MIAVPDPERFIGGTPPPEHWLVACRSGELRRRPLPRRIMGRPLVLFRDGAGTAFALADNCPHRNLPLSGGRVRDGRLVCPNHGWQFDGGGRCFDIPGLYGAAGRSTRTVPSYPVRERDGVVWVSPAPELAAGREPPPLAGPGARGRPRIVAAFAVDAPAERVREYFRGDRRTHLRLLAALVGGAPGAMVTLWVTPQTPASARVYSVAAGRAGSPRYLLARVASGALLRLAIRRDQAILGERRQDQGTSLSG